MTTRTDNPAVYPAIREQFQQAAKLAERLAGKDRYSLAFSSCRHEAGTTTVAINFAASLAGAAGTRVALVEANFRSPSFRNIFGFNSGAGLAEVLSGESDLDSALQAHPDFDGVSILNAGSSSPDPAALMEHTGLQRAMAQLRETFDVVLLDTAPVNAYPDTISIGAQVDGVVLVVEVDRESREVAGHANYLLKSAGIPLLGAILNRRRYFIPGWIYRLL